MLNSLAKYHGADVIAVDGEVGMVARFLVDLNQWVVRYIVVNTGNWLAGHEVLISPWSLAAGTKTGPDITLSLSRDQVKNSPAYDATQALTREHEHALLGYYGYPLYWSGPMLWGPVPAAAAGAAPDVLSGRAEGVEPPIGTTSALMDSDVSGLADTREVFGTHLQAADGEIGHVDDFLVEPDTWRIRYLIVDTNNWWIGKHVLIAPEWIEQFEWPDHRLHVSVDRASIQEAPEYDANSVLSRDDEVALYRHYRRGPYWEDREG
jgi:hypothetical protein